MMGAVAPGMDGNRLKYDGLIRNDGPGSGARGRAPWNRTRAAATTTLTERGDRCLGGIDPDRKP